MAKVISNVSLAALMTVGLIGSPLALAEIDGVSEKPLVRAIKGESLWVSFDQADAQYNAIIKSGEKINKRISALKKDTSGSKEQQAARYYLASMFQWRHGNLDSALKSIDQALEIGRYGELLRQKARLLDAAGKTKEAIASYQDALPLLSGQVRQNTELRLALLQADEDIQPLLKLAERSDAEMKNRVALILAIYGETGEASRLYNLSKDASEQEQLKYYLRIAEWALQDLNVLKAQDAAWQAVQLAESREDRLYTLALLTESHRKDDTLDALVEKLATNSKSLGDDARSLWVSLLRETGRADEALTKLKGRAESESDAVKRQLIGLYQESGKVTEMESELKRLMSVDKTETIWPQGLAEYYLERGDKASAKQAWKQFVDQNSDPAPLLSGANSMKKLNFDELALSAAAKAQQDGSSIKKAAMFRFDLYLDRGKQKDAEKVLIDLDKTLAASDPLRKVVAQSYERLSMPKEALRVMTVFAESGAEQDISAKQYLAELQLSAAEPADAIKSLMASLPGAAESQKRLITSRIIQAAKEAKTLDSMVAKLTKRLSENELAEWEVDFLIEVYSRQNEGKKALALLEKRYSQPGADDVEGLKKKAQLYRELKDFVAYDKVLATLAEKDPDGAVFHIRGRIMNYIDTLRHSAKNDQEVYTTLTGLLDDYSKVSGKGAAREFQAGVLSMAGQREEALTMFREILAEDSSRVDNYLAIGNQLNAMRQKDQALAMYQYLVEGTERTEITWAALDGILNMEPGKGPLKWAQRLALEKLSASPNKFDFYRQLADLSSDLGELDIQLAVLQNGLSAEPELRMSTLRELLRFTSTKQEAGPIFGGAQLSPNAQKHVMFGRRLLALGLALPPDVHISLGKAMMDAGDTEAALTAVKQAVENTGSGELLLQAAGIFEQADDDVSALVLYEKALITDPTNISLQVKTALVNERLGNNERSYELYLNGLTNLLERQPAKIAELVVSSSIPGAQVAELDPILLEEGKETKNAFFSSGSTKAADLKYYYIPLRNGLTRALMGNSTKQATVVTQLDQNYQKALSEVENMEGERLERLANYPRLNEYAQLMRYLNFIYRNISIVNTMDETLFGLFPNDPLLAEILVAHHLEWGSAGYGNFVSQSDVIADHQKQLVAEKLAAAQSEKVEGLPAIKTISSTPANSFAPQTAPLKPDQEAAKETLKAALAEGDPKAILNATKKLIDLGLLYQALEMAGDKIPVDQRKNLARFVIANIQGDNLKAVQLTASNNGNFNPYTSLDSRKLTWNEKLTQWLGEPVLTDEQLIAVSTLDEQELRKVLDFQRGEWVDYISLYRSLSIDARPEWLKTFIKQADQNLKFQLPGILSALLTLPLSDEEQKAIKASLDLLPVMPFADTTLARIDIHPDNIDTARSWAEIISAKQAKILPDPVFEPNLLRCEGKLDKALDKLVEIYFEGDLPPRFPGQPGTRQPQQFLQDYTSTLIAGNEAELVSLVESYNVENDELLNDKIEWLVQLYRNLYADSLSKHLDALKALQELQPDNIQLLAALQNLYRRNGDYFKEIQSRLSQYEAAAVEQKGWISNSLSNSYQQLDNPIKALEFSNSQQPGRNLVASKPVYDVKTIKAALESKDHSQLRREMASLWQKVESTEQAPKDNVSGNVTQGLTVDRLVNLELRESSNNPYLQRAENIQSKPEKLLPSLVKHPLGVEILSGWLNGVRGRLLGQAEELVGALADAYVHQGSTGQKFSKLGERILNNQVNDKDIALWLAIASRVPELAKSESASKVFNHYQNIENSYRPPLAKLIASFLVTRGEHEQARKCYESLINWKIASRDQMENSIRFTGQIDTGISGVLLQAEKTLEQSQYLNLLSSTLSQVKPDKSYLISEFSKLVLAHLSVSKDPKAYYQRAKDIVDNAFVDLLNGGDKGDFSGSRFANLQLVMSARIKLGKREAALESWIDMAVEAEENKRRMQNLSGARYQQQDRESMERQQEQRFFNMFLGANTVSLDQAKSKSSLLDASDPDWLSQVDQSLQRAIEQRELSRDVGIDLLLQLADACKKGGLDTQLANIFEFLRQQISYKDELSNTTIATVFQKANEFGQQLNAPKLEKELLQQGAIKPEHMAVTVERIAARDGVKEAFDLGAKLLEYTLNDALMSTMISLAENAGETEQAQEWRVLQKKAQIARKELNATRAKDA
ncbi:hypothetical protein QP938_05320 [Porticoccaceae bacterium LTM1]|nr:hypothetical protein QP938_05320 [Porticoccaceae bacterium LTM1]